ncbi:hypothetical protein ACIQ9P_05725 [Kitasatospora sp. NPDC094019]|uniref:hypothetical protein n=1 Tax=Kitasatospora sp. NPDC094019 TaxID=3364091 RepID=UPI003802EBCF
MDDVDDLIAKPTVPPAQARPRPVLSPEEHAPGPLAPDERERRADILARVRRANHPTIR